MVQTAAPAARNAATENFPVGSWLIAAKLRPAVAVYYRFARAADDIADDPAKDAAEKIRRLDAFDATLTGKSDTEAAALEVREVFAASGISIEHARHLLQAFRADTVNRPCRSWSDLLAYCRYSAAPVGRFILELHGEDRAAWNAADALCAALQILNHLQDCQADWRDLRRLYIPRDWLDAEKLSPDMLLATRTPDDLRRVFDRVLEGVERLNLAAASLPGLIADRRLRMEVTAILFLSRRLARRLSRRDPLAGRVGVSNLDKLSALLRGAVLGWWR